MARINRTIKRTAPKVKQVLTHGGAPTTATNNPGLELNKCLATCLLWENAFYERADSIADRISKLVAQVGAKDPMLVAEAINHSRNKMQIRSASQFAAVEFLKWYSKNRTRNSVAANSQWAVEKALQAAIQRPDEMGEALALYWKGQKDAPIPATLKRVLADKFTTFKPYHLAKWNRDADIKLRDIMFLTHPKPTSSTQTRLFEQIANDSLPAPETWEVELSAGKDKRATWVRLLQEDKLGGMALLMNLRNMHDVGVPEALVVSALMRNDFNRVLPYRFLTAAKNAPWYQDALEQAFIKMCASVPKLGGESVIIVDCSGSMGASLSAKSTMNRMDAAISLAIVAANVCESATVYATAGCDSSRKHATERLDHDGGFTVADPFGDVRRRIGGGGIFTAQVMEYVEKDLQGLTPDRVLIITDEQDCDLVRKPSSAKAIGRSGNYIMNVAPYKFGVGETNQWTEISGFSERVFDYMAAHEGLA
jgi:60 kDa SS-A/Ro ribonucleoprotein